MALGMPYGRDPKTTSTTKRQSFLIGSCFGRGWSKTPEEDRAVEQAEAREEEGREFGAARPR